MTQIKSTISFQSTLPVWGATPRSVTIPAPSLYFNPRSPCGERLYNRLCRPADYPYLNIDATVIYGLGGITGSLTYEQTQIDGPYNTYTRQGLPAGPISNPGLNSISAALNPSDTNYYFYALDESTGYHHFSETYDEHNRFLESQNG